MTDAHADAMARPLWRRIVDFPLVAMVIALALLVGTVWLANLALRQVPHMGLPDASREMMAGLVVIALVVAVYIFAICKLGEQPRDDLRRAHAGPRPWARAARRDIFILAGDVGRGAGGGVRHRRHRQRAFDPVRSRHLRDHPRSDGRIAVPRNPVPPSGGFRRQLVRTGADLGPVRGGAYLQPQRDNLLVVRDRGRGGNLAWRGLYADPQPVGANRDPRGVEFHPGRNLRRAGIGDRRHRAGRGEAVRPGIAVGRVVRAGGVDHCAWSSRPRQGSGWSCGRCAPVISSGHGGSGGGWRDQRKL